MADELSDIAETADEAYRDVREAILGLRETVREDDGLEGSLREYLRKYSRQTGIAATLTCEGDTRRVLSPRSEVQLLRVVQEALTNTRKYARRPARHRPDRLPRRRGDAHDRGRWGRLRSFDRRRARWRAASASPPCGSGSSRSAAASMCILPRTRGRRSSSGSTQRTLVGHLPPKIRVLLVDDQPLFRRALATLIGAQFDMTVVGEGENGRDALEKVRALQPGPRRDGREHAGRLGRRRRQPRSAPRASRPRS